LQLPAHHLVTHGVVVGMTGSGKTGLVTVMIEDALRNAISVLVIDVKRDRWFTMRAAFAPTSYRCSSR
jgi:type IV secretory pathway VirB4 component